ncbi:MAG: hypothetical protein H6742_14745 [Alphaproteobacteria bacterium]|nr:hypothetical protein [Alphaproteobacteria bacterium]
MIRAIGWSNDPFSPAEPGRLCRGRERWIESFQLDDPPELHRVVVSGAAFTDDSARDADRGLSCSGVELHQVIDALFGDDIVVAWCEEGHPLQIPDGAIGVEEYDLRRPGGPLFRWTVRWLMVCETVEQLQAALAAGAECLTVHPGPDDEEAAGELPALDDDGQPVSALRDAIFLLTGSRHHGQPVRRFQPGAIAVALDHCDVLVLVHQDKHTPCLAIYSEDPIDVDDVMVDLARAAGALAVPFAIPPMLARWDRALWELRQDWDEDKDGEFPVPPAPEGSWGWGRRRKKGRRDDGDGYDEE